MSIPIIDFRKVSSFRPLEQVPFALFANGTCNSAARPLKKDFEFHTAPRMNSSRCRRSLQVAYLVAASAARRDDTGRNFSNFEPSSLPLLVFELREIVFYRLSVDLVGLNIFIFWPAG